MYNPKVSIVIPAYNAANYLSAAINSALAQTYSNIEIIVVNDGSKDNGATENIALSYGDKIRYFYKENGGSSSALNFGIYKMTGEWFSWLSHDDIYASDKIEKQIKYLDQLNCCDDELNKQILFSAHHLIDSKGKIIHYCNVIKERRLSKKIDEFAHNGYLVSEPTTYNFYGCSCLVHKKAFDDVGCFDEKLRLINDAEMWYRLYSSNYYVHYLPEPLTMARIHANQISKSISYSYHNLEQDMFWNRCLDWLIENYPQNTELFLNFARNAYLKTRTNEGDRAFSHIGMPKIKKKVLKIIYMCEAKVWKSLKKIYIKLKT